MAFQVLHSADWHLGKRLYHKSRKREFHLFLNWLLEQLEGIDLLLLAGDIFDTNTPPVWAQEQYYQFLYRASQCCEIVVCAGNHDSGTVSRSPPRTLFKALRVHVLGNPIAQSCKIRCKVSLSTSSTKPTPPPELIPI